MGKYIQKQSPKSSGEVVQMETGVVTRAKARALQAQDSNYLQLRSGRLQKKPIQARKRKPRVNRRKWGNDKNASADKVSIELEKVGENGVAEDEPIGDNLDRASRETTPVNLIRDPNVIRSPGPWTRPGKRRPQEPPCILNFHSEFKEVTYWEPFFVRAEARQREEFIQKYNFDPVNDEPLPGRFEWEKLDPKQEEVNPKPKA